ncbi:MAG: response regulator [Caulobacteraceae bacterium]
MAVVDDDAALRSALAYSLEGEGFQVSVFESGEAVLDLPELPAVDCWIVDVRLSGVDGIDFLDRLRARRLGSVAILITTPTPAIAKRAQSAGLFIVEKPLLSDQLAREIRARVAQGPMGDDARAGL